MWTKKNKANKLFVNVIWLLFCWMCFYFFLFSDDVKSSLIAMWRKKTFLNSYIIWSNKIENVLKIMSYLFYWTYLNVKNDVVYGAFEASGKFRFTNSLIHHQHLTRFWKSLLNIPLHFLSYSKSFFFFGGNMT